MMTPRKPPVYAPNGSTRCTPVFLGTILVVLAILSAAAGCANQQYNQTLRNAESEFPLNSPNFETSVAHAVGNASCFYILFSIPLCNDQSLATIAWQRMRENAQLEGRSAQLVNVFEDRSLNWNFLYLFYEEHYTVSASVITYK